MDYSTWKEKQLLVTNILLDPLNPRIPPTDEQLDQNSLIAELVNHDKVYELARNIANNGYYPAESIIVAKENNKTIVIEGNRRMAALKLLVAPEAAPADLIPKFRALSNKTDINKIKTVKVVFAPNRQAVAPLLMSKHTKPQVESWKPLMKGRFYHGLLQTGITVKDLSQEYNVSVSDIISFLRLYKMYRIACTLDLPNDVANIVRNPREFNATTISRFYSHNVALDFLGISFDTGDGIVGNIDEAEFKKGYKKLITDITTGKVISRTIDKSEDVKEYLATFSEQEKPDLSKKGSFTSDTLLSTAHEATVGVITKPKQVVKKPKPKPTGLIPSHISCEVNNQRIYDVFNELKTLPTAKYANATAVLFRSLLEMALCHYLSVSGELEIIIQSEKQKREQKGIKLEKDWQPGLRQMLTHLIDPSCNIIKNNPNLLKTLRKFISQRDELFSHDSLNFFVHNQYYPPNEDMLRSFWAQLEGLFQIILVEPDAD